MKKPVTIQTMRYIYQGDLLDQIPAKYHDDVGNAINNSDTSFGNNADTMMSVSDFADCLNSAEVPARTITKVLNMIPEGVLISLGC